MPKHLDPALTRSVNELLRCEAARDPRGSVTATFVKESLGTSERDAILALSSLERSGFLTLVYHDTCDRGHVNHDSIEDPDTGIGFCPGCRRDTAHRRYVLYRFTEALQGRDDDPKAQRRKAPRYRYKRLATSAH